MPLFKTIAIGPAPSKKSDDVGAHGYTNYALIIYDYLVLMFMSFFVWRCSTTKTMLPFFRANVSKRHLDIGCGTGYFLEHGNIPLDAEVSLCDLNQNCLEKSKARFGRPNTECLLHNIFQPLPSDAGPFDSISMFYLLHCLPGPVSRKCEIFKHLKYNLSADGVLFGSNVLGPTGDHTWLSRLALRRLNYLSHMDNMGDTRAAFEEALRENYHEVDTKCEV